MNGVPKAYSNVTRIEIIDQTGRAFVGYNMSDVQISMQDDGRTLKIFCKKDTTKPAQGGIEVREQRVWALPWVAVFLFGAVMLGMHAAFH